VPDTPQPEGPRPDGLGRPRLGVPARQGGEGDIEVYAADEQAVVPVELGRWAALADAVLRAEGVSGHAELSLLFLAEDEIAALNEEFMDADGSTDVLAFPIDAAEAGVMLEVTSTPMTGTGPHRSEPDPADLPLLLGDVVICPEVAQRQAPEHAGTLDDELALLVVHGVLHVLGYDHAEAGEAERMRARERALLEAHHWGGPAPAGFRQEQS
jgi:probable rRNA maturation factor